MRIAFILYGLPDERSGGFLYDRYLVDRLRTKGHEVQVFSQREGGFLCRLLGNSKKLCTEILCFNPSILIEDELNHASLFIVNKQFKSKIKVPILSVVHHLRCEEQLNRLSRFVTKKIESQFLRECDAFIFNSKNTLQTVNRLLKTEIVSYRIVYPGKDNLEVLKKKQKEDGILRLLFVGNIIPRKNLEMVVRVLKKISGEQWQFNICGAGDSDPAYMKKLHSLSSELEKDGQIVYNGRVSNKELSLFFAEADLLIAPSDWEGFGIIYLEAQRAGVVPIASNKGGAKEIIEDGISGFLVSSQEDNPLEILLRGFLYHPEKLRKMSANLLEKATRFNTWDETMDQAVSFIEEIG